MNKAQICWFWWFQSAIGRIRLGEGVPGGFRGLKNVKHRVKIIADQIIRIFRATLAENQMFEVTLNGSRCVLFEKLDDL